MCLSTSGRGRMLQAGTVQLVGKPIHRTHAGRSRLRTAAQVAVARVKKLTA